jgi:hypothetical protein
MLRAHSGQVAARASSSGKYSDPSKPSARSSSAYSRRDCCCSARSESLSPKYRWSPFGDAPLLFSSLVIGPIVAPGFGAKKWGDGSGVE